MTLATRRYIGWTLFVVAALFAWLLDYALHVHLRRAGLVTGVMLFSVVVLLTLFNARKKLPFLPLLRAGQVRVPVCDTYPLARAAEAYDRFAAGNKLGKIVLVT